MSESEIKAALELARSGTWNLDTDGDIWDRFGELVPQLAEECLRLREALKWYADDGHYYCDLDHDAECSAAFRDRGKRARQALGEE